MPISANKGYSVQSAGSNAGTWGAGAATALNEGVIEIMDANMGGITALSLASTTVALTQAQAQNAMIRMTGTLTANVNVGLDSGVLMTGFYMWENLTSGNYAVSLGNGVATVVLPQSRRGILWIDSVNGARIVAIVGSSSADPIPVGTVMLFYQNAAPSGWTISAALNDYALKIVSSAGGVASGSVPYSTLFGRTATDSHTLTTAQTPSHQHFVASALTTSGTLTAINYVSYAAGAGSELGYSLNGNSTDATLGLTSATGGGDGHTHDIDMRVLTASVIMATKG